MRSLTFILVVATAACAPPPEAGKLGGTCPCDPDEIVLFCGDDDVCVDVSDSDTYLPSVTEAIGAPCGGDEDGIGALTGAPFDVDNAAFVDATFGSSFDIELSSEIEPGASSPDSCQYTSTIPHLLISLPQSAWRLGRSDASAVHVVLGYFDDGEELSSQPDDGFVDITGYDPESLTLCGQLNVTFRDGANTKVTGTFEARGICGAPE